MADLSRYDSGIRYENSVKGRMEEAVVEGIMKEKIGNLEWIVAHYVWDMSDSDVKERYLDLKAAEKAARARARKAKGPRYQPDPRKYAYEPRDYGKGY